MKQYPVNYIYYYKFNLIFIEKTFLGFVLTALPTDVILSSNLRNDLLYAIGQLSYPELMIASKPDKLSLMVNQYIKLTVSFKIKTKL